MSTNWQAVLIGFFVIVVLGIVGLALPGLGQLAAALIGGAVAGYIAGGGSGEGSDTACSPGVSAALSSESCSS